MTGAVPGVDAGPVSEWLAEHVEGATPPFRFAQIAGGHSNITVRVDDAAGTARVLRRPPLHHVLSSAHDMAREHLVISGLHESAVPVPRTFGLCLDDEVTGAPFYVMEHVDGVVARNAEIARGALSTEARAEASASLTETLAALHAVDLDAAGLSGLGRHDGYLQRQLKRWYGQWNQHRTRDLDAVDEAHDALTRLAPPQRDVAIVHGDYRLDNCMLGDDGAVRAVLDWEICTIGDPLADVGLLMVYWTGPDDEPSAWAGGQATTLDGFWGRDRIASHYGEITGRDLSGLDYYVAFAFWKLACILEGVYARYLGGALGDQDPSQLEPFARQVEAAAATSLQLLEPHR